MCVIFMCNLFKFSHSFLDTFFGHRQGVSRVCVSIIISRSAVDGEVNQRNDINNTIFVLL